MPKCLDSGSRLPTPGGREATGLVCEPRHPAQPPSPPTHILVRDPIASQRGQCCLRESLLPSKSPHPLGEPVWHSHSGGFDLSSGPVTYLNRLVRKPGHGAYCFAKVLPKAGTGYMRGSTTKCHMQPHISTTSPPSAPPPPI